MLAIAVAGPFLKILVISLALRLAGGILEPVSDEKISGRSTPRAKPDGACQHHTGAVLFGICGVYACYYILQRGGGVMGGFAG